MFYICGKLPVSPSEPENILRQYDDSWSLNFSKSLQKKK